MAKFGPPPPLDTGVIVNDRFEIRKGYSRRLMRGSVGERFLAFDRSTRQAVCLMVLREEVRFPGPNEELRQDLLLARLIDHPNVCRVVDAVPSLWGPILVTEEIHGQTLYAQIHEKKAQGGYTVGELRRIAADVCAGLAAIHAQGLIQGAITPGNVMVSEGRAVILECGLARQRAHSWMCRDGWFTGPSCVAPPFVGIPNYMSPERLRDGTHSPEDDVYAMALTLWAMSTCHVPEPEGWPSLPLSGLNWWAQISSLARLRSEQTDSCWPPPEPYDKPRAKTLRSRTSVNVLAELSIDEIKQVFRALNEAPEMRPQARHMRFLSPPQGAADPIVIRRERLDPGRLDGAHMTTFTPGAQALLITFAANAPGVVGTLLLLDNPLMTVGSRGDQDLVIPETTVSGTHAVLRWQAGSWQLEDRGSTHGSYAEHSYERAAHVAIAHGGEAQIGGCRVKLVSFGPDSVAHRRARQYLGKRDGLTGLLLREHLMKAIDEDGLFSDWNESPIHVARYELRRPNQQVSERPTVLEMLALREAARRVAELTERLLLCLTPVVAGRTGPFTFAVSIAGATSDDARSMVEQVTSQVQDLLPDTLELKATLVKGERGSMARSLLDEQPRCGKCQQV